MVRPKPETLGSLGRAPARTSRIPITPLPPSEPPTRARPDPALGPRRVVRQRRAQVPVTRARGDACSCSSTRTRTARSRLRVGVSYTLPDDKVLVSERLDEVRVTIKGPWQRLRKFDEREVDRINLDLRHAPTGDLAITPDMIHLPSGLQVTSISPHTVHVAFDRRVEKVVEVVPAVSGRPAARLRAQRGQARAGDRQGPRRGDARSRRCRRSVPARFRSRGAPRASSPRPRSCRPTASTSRAVPGWWSTSPIDEELVTRKLLALPVTVRGDGIDQPERGPTHWRAVPSQVDVTLTGTLLVGREGADDDRPRGRGSPRPATASRVMSTSHSRACRRALACRSPRSG